MSLHAAGQGSTEPKLKLYATKIINIVGGPGCNKGLIVSGIMFHLKLLQKKVEYIPSIAREYVWLGKQDKLRNQFEIAEEQYKMLKALDGKVEYLITDGSLYQCDFYNVFDHKNIADKMKVSEQIKVWLSDFDNINLWVDRGDTPMEAGRNMSLEKAMEIDRSMLNFLENKHELLYQTLTQDPQKIHSFVRNLTKQS